MIDLFIMHCIAILKLEKRNIEDIHLYHQLVFISVIEWNTPLYLLRTCHHSKYKVKGFHCEFSGMAKYCLLCPTDVNDLYGSLR